MNKTAKAVLSLNNLSKIYRQGNIALEVFKEINLGIMSGDLIAIVGSSGSGKSTLLQIAGLLDSASSGEVIYHCAAADYAGKIKTMKSDLIRLNYIGFIYQYHHLLKDFNARENIAMPRLIAGHNKLEALEEADHLLREVGLYDKRYNMPGELSGGQQQRVAVARSLINKPQIILADEPTGNLDPYSAEEVLNLFLRIADEQKAAVVMVTHNYKVAQKMHKAYALKFGSLQLIDKYDIDNFIAKT